VVPPAAAVWLAGRRLAAPGRSPGASPAAARVFEALAVPVIGRRSPG
jgi:hypothetical protein